MKKGLITAFACAFFAMAIPFGVSAEEGEPIHGYSRQADAAEMKNEVHYYESGINDGKDYYYKFKTGGDDGIYLISLASVVGSTTSSGTVNVTVMNTYGTPVDGAAAGGAGATYRNTLNGKASDIVLPVSGLSKNEYYYVCVNTNDGDSSTQLPITNKISVRFVSFRPADAFTMKAGNGTLDFAWNNVQSVNTYDNLKSFDGFRIELFANNVTKIKEVGNGQATSFSLSTRDADLLALGYPAKSVRIRLGCLQSYRSVFEDEISVTKCVFSSNVYNTEVVKAKTESTVSEFKYKITKVAGDGSGTVTLLGYSDAKKATKKLKVPSTVRIKGTDYKVTVIDAKAFKGIKKITTVEIGDNVTEIGANAFDGCSGLKKVTFKTKGLKTVGKSAFVNINKGVKVFCPDKKLKKKYKKLLNKKIVNSVTYKI